MADITITVRATLAWWFTPYIYCLAACCAIMNCEPNEDRLNYWIDRALRLEVV